MMNEIRNKKVGFHCEENFNSTKQSSTLVSNQCLNNIHTVGKKAEDCRVGVSYLLAIVTRIGRSLEKILFKIFRDDASFSTPTALGVQRHSEPQVKNPEKNTFKDWILRFAFAPLRMTIHTLPLAAVLSAGMINESWATIDGGTCGTGCNWSYNTETKALTLSGNGTMDDFDWDYDEEGYDTPWRAYKDQITSVSVDKSSTLSNIGQGAFYEATSLQSVELPNVTSIGDFAFNYAEALQSVNMPQVTSIGDYAFSGANSLQSVDMPNVKTIGDSAFQDAWSLQSVTMPNVNSIGTNAFLMATSLQSVDMPNVTSIGDGAFDLASSLSYVGLNPNGSVSIGDAFYGTNISGCGTGDNYSKCNYCTNSSTNTSASTNISNKTTMFQPYASGGGGECQASCNGGYTASGSLCKKDSDVTIPENCRTYNNGCTQCSTGYLAKEGGCVEPSACNGEYIVDSENGTCKKMPGCVDYANGACGGCESGYYKKDGGCVSAIEGCGSGYLEKDSVCISASQGCGEGYKDMGGFCNRVRYTPAEAAKVLHDGNDNEVVITFKVNM